MPKLELDELLIQLIGRAQDVVAAQGRLRGLLRANQAIVGNLSLPVLLRRIVEAACELAQARYGALGVMDESGGLEQFVHVGVSAEVAARMDHLPEGKGLLGALIADPHPIRLAQMDADPRSAGFPEGHPAMTSFLGVPIRVRDELFGNLYLTENTNGEFSAEDEELVLALAATAGVAIENARLFEEARRRQDWLQASTEVTQRLLSTDGEEPLALITRQSLRIADADIVAIVLPTDGGTNLIVHTAVGLGADDLIGLTTPLAGTLVGRALITARPVMVADMAAELGQAYSLTEGVTVGPVMVVPLGGVQTVLGVLVIGRTSQRHGFGAADLEMASTFADHATVALELATARTDRQRIALLEDRNRIARDLHDHVIQRLFAIGLTVQSVASGRRPEDASARLDGVVSDMDDTIRRTRTAIFQLRGPLGPETGTVRARLLAVAAEVSTLLGFQAEMRFRGPIEAVVTEGIADDLVAVTREALTNIARHASADRAEVELTSAPDQLSLEITDNGIGVAATGRRSGLANLRQRAESYGGSLTIGANPIPAQKTQEGTRLLWTIPLT